MAKQKLSNKQVFNHYCGHGSIVDLLSFGHIYSSDIEDNELKRLWKIAELQAIAYTEVCGQIQEILEENA